MDAGEQVTGLRHCGQVTAVLETRDARGYIRRRRECVVCKERFTTREVITKGGSLKMVTMEIWAAVCRERDYQDEKWGNHPHTIFEWIGIMEKELSEAKAAYFQRPADTEMLKEILQVVSVGVACMEQHGIRER